MFPLLLALASLADWVPMRWPSGDSASLELLNGTPVNCLLLTSESASVKFIEAARAKNIATLLIAKGNTNVQDAKKLNMAGIVIEGVTTELLRQMESDDFVVVSLPSRYEMSIVAGQKLAGTWQGVWPGVNQTEEDTAKAAPSGAPWIDTNSGFLRFVRAWTSAPVWIANRPPEKGLINPVRYLQAIGDAAMCGARWVVSLDVDFEKRLLAREGKALASWKRICDLLRHVETNKQWRGFLPAGQMAVLQDATSGALLSGGILDMIAVRHTPVQPVPSSNLSKDSMRRAKMAVNVNPSVLTEEQRAMVSTFTKSGGTVLTSPPGWKFPAPKPGQLTVDQDAVKQLDEIWKELNTMTGRKNLGARLFNVGSMLSNLLVSPDGKMEVLHLVNYSDFPAESLTAHVLGSWKKATLVSPDGPPRKLETYEVEEGTGVDVPLVHSFATIVLE